MAKKNRFVTPGVERLTLSDGEWIEIKRELTAGESKGISLGSVRSVRTDPTTGKDAYDLDTVKLSFAKVSTYLLDWSFTDANDKRVPVTADAIRALNSDAFREVEAAIDAYVNAQEAARAEEKKEPAPAPVSS